MSYLDRAFDNTLEHFYCPSGQFAKKKSNLNFKNCIFVHPYNFFSKQLFENLTTEKVICVNKNTIFLFNFEFFRKLSSWTVKIVQCIVQGPVQVRQILTKYIIVFLWKSNQDIVFLYCYHQFHVYFEYNMILKFQNSISFVKGSWF